ncbi:MAG: hypothetical protein KGH61_02215 [Candidatus Micrarchaeota archaeon]|nr:hypothetical protein [Candidatus Micrarchaeota archaeon]MDE1847743.1 hypothetical protein [Candidatus Micrarchaeota archaeon]MDE1863886.1 hypothetical protein [Candidatus Micrarchaeota archaeon]
MGYKATINKRVRYVKVYRIVKRVNQNTNVATEFMQKFVDRFFLGRKKVEA